jgi:hypothetical protein
MAESPKLKLLKFPKPRPKKRHPDEVEVERMMKRLRNLIASFNGKMCNTSLLGCLEFMKDEILHPDMETEDDS